MAQKKAKKPNQSKQITNRRARHDYALGDSLLVGISLTGPEVRNLRNGRGNLTGAYVTVKDNELWLLNATINASPSAPIKDTEQTRTRKLLAKRREINNLVQAKQQGSTIIPLEILTTGRYIKVRIAVGKGKRQYDKRLTLKKRDDERDVNRALKYR
ncbi:MAG: SsrA-binding protein SmpB [Candidatus Saccharimonadales bacterium]